MQKFFLWIGLFTTFLIVTFSCSTIEEIHDPLVEIVNAAPEFIKEMMDSSEYEIQIIYTQVHRDKNNFPHLQSFYFNKNDSEYFYPASTVKMPVAFLALQRINELKQEFSQVDRYTRIQIDSIHPTQSPVLRDSSSSTGYPNVAHYIEKIFSISDNDAYNRLYEFLGQDYINEELREKGIFKNSRIRTRVGITGFDTENNKYTNPIQLIDSDGEVIYEQDEYYALYSEFPQLNNTIKGIGYFDDALDTIIYNPFEMGEKNYISLSDLESSLRAVIFPETVSPENRFNLTGNQYDFLYQTMSKTPKDFEFLENNHKDYHDSYVKFFCNGDTKEPIPDYIKIFNKVGWAYGTLTDCSYIIDLKNNIEFFLTATILVNENQIFNDGQYEYEKKGLPFFAALGKAVYNYELKRTRPYPPDLSNLKN